MIELDVEVDPEKEKLIEEKEDASFARERDIKPGTAKSRKHLDDPQEGQELLLTTQEIEAEAEDLVTVEIAATTPETEEIEVEEETRGLTLPTAEINALIPQIPGTERKNARLVLRDHHPEVQGSTLEAQDRQDQLTAETDQQCEADQALQGRQETRRDQASPEL